MSNGAENGTKKTLLPTAVGWIALLLLSGYAVFLHQGLAYPPGGWASQWWHPTQFLLLNPTTGGWADVPAFGASVLSLPSLLLASLVFLGTRSAIARTLAVSWVIAGVLFCMIGFASSGVWEAFHWRASVVLTLIALALGTTIMSPALSAAWLRRSVVARLLIYVPLAFAIIALMRNATGTDEALMANISPWPGITVFGLEMGSYTIVGVLFGLAIGLGALTQWGKRPGLVLAGVLIGCVFPALWFYERFTNTEPGALVGLAVATAVVLGFASITRGDRAATLSRRAALFALGALLVIAPIYAGRAWAAADYTLNKFVRARTLNDALAEYYIKEGVYPDSLEELTEGAYLETLPQPRVGFETLYDLGLLPPVRFSYRSLGSSYVLEFNSTEWVQCAYNPPWSVAGGEYADAEYEYDEEYEDEYAEDAGGAWSCPDTRPALWGDPQSDEYEEYRDEYDDEDGDEEDA